MKRKLTARVRVELSPHGKTHHPEIKEGEADCEVTMEDHKVVDIRRTSEIEPLTSSSSSGAATDAYRSGWDAVFGKGKARAKA